MSQNENQNPELQLKSAERQKFSVRALCFITDICIASFISFLLAYMVYQTKNYELFFQKGLDLIGRNEEVLNQLSTALGDYFDFYFVFLSFSSIISVLYNLIEAFYPASPAKLIFRLRISSISTRELSVAQLLIRWTAKYAATLGTILFMLTQSVMIQSIFGFVSMVFFFGYFYALAADRMALHDKISGTCVFKSSEIDTY